MEEIYQDAQGRGHSRRLVTWDEVDTLAFPGYVTAHLDYLATGEGATIALALLHVADPHQLRRAIEASFGSHFARGAQFAEGLHPPLQLRRLIPEHLTEILRQIEDGRGPAGFAFHTTLHMNYS